MGRNGRIAERMVFQCQLCKETFVLASTPVFEDITHDFTSWGASLGKFMDFHDKHCHFQTGRTMEQSYQVYFEDLVKEGGR